MEPESADSPLDPIKLVLLVDLANFRPRKDGRKLEDSREVFLGNRPWRQSSKGKSNGRKEQKELTTLEYIDKCLSELRRQTPGSIIISICDRSVKDSLKRMEWSELESRGRLPISNPEKVHFTQSKEADDALHQAGERFDLPIVSFDRFEGKYKGPIFAQSYDVKNHCFLFEEIRDKRYSGLKLDDWWSANVGKIPENWSRVFTVADIGALKQEILEPAFSSLFESSGGLTQRLGFSRNILELLGIRKSGSNEGQESEPIGVVVQIVSNSVSEKPRIYADEWLRLERNQGEVVSLIGRLVDSESGQIVEWIRDYRPIAIIGDSIPVSTGNDRFVVVTGRLEQNGDLFSIHLDSASEVQRMRFRDIVAERPIRLRDEKSLGDFEPEKWSFPSFLPSLNFRQRLRSSRAKPGNDSVPVVVPVVVDPDPVVDVVVDPVVVDVPVVVVDPVVVDVPVVVVDPVVVDVPVVVVDPVVVDVPEKSKVLLGSIAIVAISVLLIVSKFLLF